MPYRDAPLGPQPHARGDGGIIDDMVRQFADPYAFLRELVQNGIDAGATRIEVRIERAAATIRTSVIDDGTGMTRATIEGPLLTLFESSKENDASKIGKYGVGFVSIFAINPMIVEVATWRSGESWLLRLFGDRSFELETAPPHDGHGTEVTLVNELDETRLAQHEQRVVTALTTWCRHAIVPIFLSTEGSPLAREINTPLTVPGVLVSTITEGDTHFAVGVGAVIDTAREFAGFYNRGLTLLESTSGEHVRPGIRFKLDSPRLAHTLSRDDIRRDDSYHAAYGALDRIIQGPLVEQLTTSLRNATIAALDGPCDRYLALLDLAALPAFERTRPCIEVPLIEAAGVSGTSLLSDLAANENATGSRAILFADAPSAITEALAAAGRPVVRHSRLATALGRFVAVPVMLAASAVSVITDVPEVEPLVGEVARLAVVVGREVAAVRFAKFEGCLAGAAFRLAPRELTRVLVPAADETQPRWRKSSALFLNVDHELVRLARRRAKLDVRIAGHLLFRALLLDGGAIAERDVDLLLFAARRA